jgi:hypothetical protein
MASRSKITRVTLTDKTEADLVLIGLVSSEADYKVSQLINKKLSISLRHQRTIDIEINAGEKDSFSRYAFSSGSPEVTYYLISNRSEKNVIFKKLKKIDYLFLIQDHYNVCNIDLIATRLREIEKITALFQLDLKEIKDKNLAYITP